MLRADDMGENTAEVSRAKVGDVEIEVRQVMEMTDLAPEEVPNDEGGPE
jgi:hypothetical protein